MRYAVAILVIVSIFRCNSQHVQSVVRGNDEFTANTYKELTKKSDDNIIVSGLSAEIILALLANGAKGETQSELLKGLSLPTNVVMVNRGYDEITTSLKINTEELKLLSANKLYPAKGFAIEKKFDNTAINVYQASVENLNYSNQDLAANTINQWVEEQTNHKIQKLISPSQLNSDTVLVLVNALYFSGKWRVHFSPLKSSFYTSSTVSKEIDSMYSEADVLYGYCNKRKVKFLELGFRGGEVSMTIILPDSVTGLEAVEQNVADYLKPYKLEKSRVAITLPKFTINTSIDFRPILEKFGIKTIFSNQSDLSDISDAAPLHVDFILQKSFINVTETGVEAAAATIVGVIAISANLPPPPIQHEFKADHSFFFYIRDNTSGVTLFAGRYKQ